VLVVVAVVAGIEFAVAVSFPDSMPLASGTITATCPFLASPKNNSAGRCRKMLKMIWTLETPGNASTLIPSSTFSTLTP
jgi:hypothetical protein